MTRKDAVYTWSEKNKQFEQLCKVQQYRGFDIRTYAVFGDSMRPAHKEYEVNFPGSSINYPQVFSRNREGIEEQKGRINFMYGPWGLKTLLEEVGTMVRDGQRVLVEWREPAAIRNKLGIIADTHFDRSIITVSGSRIDCERDKIIAIRRLSPDEGLLKKEVWFLLLHRGADNTFFFDSSKAFATKKETVRFAKTCDAKAGLERAVLQLSKCSDHVKERVLNDTAIVPYALWRSVARCEAGPFRKGTFSVYLRDWETGLCYYRFSDEAAALSWMRRNCIARGKGAWVPGEVPYYNGSQVQIGMY